MLGDKRLPERFWEKVSVEPNSGCWLWLASTTFGYGVFGWRGKTPYAYQVAYRELVGPVPDGLELDHLCRTPLCCNPEHLEPVTHAENVRRGSAGKRMTAVTHCPKGHEYAGHNLIIHKRGGRVCRECHRLASLAWMDKNNPPKRPRLPR